MNGKPIQRVKRFLYLGRWFDENDDDSYCINENIKKARGRWNSIANILKREGANAAVMGRFYLTIMQAVLLYGAESWTINKRNMGKLNSFHYRSVRHMTGHHIQKRGEVWEYPKHEPLLKKAKLFPIEKYIERRRGTLRKYLMECKPNLMQKAYSTSKHCYDAHKILWWKQPWIEKRTLDQFQRTWLEE